MTTTNIVSDLKFVLDALKGTSPVSITFAQITFEEGRMWARNGRVRVVAPYDGDLRGTAPAAELLRIAQACGDREIKIKAKGEDRIAVSAGSFRATVPMTAKTEEAPELDLDGDWHKIDPNLFPLLAGCLRDFIDPKSARFWMSGIIFYEDRVVGTDGHVLNSIKVDCPIKNVVLPLYAAEFISKVEEQPTEARVTGEGAHVAVRWDTGHWYDTSTYDSSGAQQATKLFPQFDEPKEDLVFVSEDLRDAIQRFEKLGAEDVIVWPDKLTTRINDSDVVEEIEGGTGATSPARWGLPILAAVLKQADKMYWPKNREPGLWSGNGCAGLAMSKGEYDR